jgi:hypothetical protein
MGLFKSKSNSDKKHDGRPKDDRKKVKYVYMASRKAVFIITGEPKKSKYSYGLPIIPLHGYYKAGEKRYTAKELADYYVVLNISKEDVEAVKGKKIVIMGYNDNEVLFVPANSKAEDGEENGISKA